ncbi:MAG: GMC family oxidoreductase N-terminal domain-containing protein [Candidatus Nezhaarchaeota archaeon]|nr:GMC family oxidoreductase N-terminal domain-containing protein [Candidatus Nezhaarchaeota archaeon]
MINADVIIIGSGAGGSVASYRLVNQGLKVVLVDAGKYVKPERARESFSPALSSIEVQRCVCVGGTTLVSLGNMLMTNAIIEKFRGFGVDLEDEVKEICKLMRVTKVPQDKLPPFAMRFIDVAEKNGLKVEVMPKSIDFSQCVGCGRCAYGCPKDAKYTALNLIRTSLQRGLILLSGFVVKKLHRLQDEIIVEGVMNGSKIKAKCRALVLAAGALETPRLLSQIHDDERIGKNLFIDPFITLGGPYNGPSAVDGIQMAVYIDYDDFLLSPHYSGLLQFQFAVRGIDHKGKGIASIMIKVADEGKGTVWPDGTIETHMTKRDLRILERGVREAKNLLLELGVKEEEIVATHVRGAHPGGTAAISYVVSRDLTINGCDGVFVADASLIPPPLGKPPILLIMSLAMKVAKRVHEYLQKGLVE